MPIFYHTSLVQFEREKSSREQEIQRELSRRENDIDILSSGRNKNTRMLGAMPVDYMEGEDHRIESVPRVRFRLNLQRSLHDIFSPALYIHADSPLASFYDSDNNFDKKELKLVSIRIIKGMTDCITQLILSGLNLISSIFYTLLILYTVPKNIISSVYASLNLSDSHSKKIYLKNSGKQILYNNILAPIISLFLSVVGLAINGLYLIPSPIIASATLGTRSISSGITYFFSQQSSNQVENDENDLGQHGSGAFNLAI